MAIAYVTGDSARGTGSSTQTISSFATTSPTDGLLLVYVASGNADVTGVTFDGNAMTLISSETSGDAYITYLYGYLNPTGTGDIVATQSDTGYMVVTAACYSGVNQSLTLDSTTTDHAASGTSKVFSTTVVNPNCWTVLCANIGNRLTSVTGGTERVNSYIGTCGATTGPDVVIFDSNATVTPGSNSMTTNHCASASNGGIFVSLAPSALATDIKAYWKLDEISGTRYDSTGNKSSLVDNNTVTSETGKLNNAARLTSANSEYLSVADNSALSITGDMSWSFWLQPGPSAIGSTTDPVLFMKYAASNLSYYMQIKVDGIQLINSDDGTTSGSSGYITTDTMALTGTWYHFVCTYTASSGTFEVYQNGVSKGTATGTLKTSIYDGNGVTEIGRYTAGTSNYYNGLIDEVGIWSRVLSETEVASLYNSGDGLAYSSISPYTSQANWTYEQDFEALTTGALNGQDSWSGDTSWVVGTTSPYTGSQCLESQVEGDAPAGIDNYKPIARTITTLSEDFDNFYFAVKYDTTGGAVRSALTVEDGTTAAMYFATTSSGASVQLYDYAGAWVTITSLANQTWAVIQAQINFTTGTYRARGNVGGTWGGWTAWGDLGGTPTSLNNLNLGRDKGAAGTGGYIYYDVISASSPATGNGLTTGLANYWNLDADSTDSVGSNDGTDTSITYSTGKVSNGAVFNATSDGIAFSDTTTIGGTSDFTLSFWIKYTSDLFIITRRDSYPADWQCFYSGTRVSFQIRNGAGFDDIFTGTAATLDSNWHHIVITRSGGTNWKLYKDGTLTDTGSSATSIPTGHTLRMGNVPSAANNGAIMTLDEVGIWSRALNFAEVQALYNGNAGLAYTSMADRVIDTFYPDPSPEVTSMDGYCGYDYGAGAGAVWSTLRSNAGNWSNDTSGDYAGFLMQSSTTSNQFLALARSIFLFDTSSLPEANTIVSAIGSWYGSTKADALSATPDMAVFDYTGSSTTAIANGDYNNIGDTAISNAISYANLTSSVYNDFNITPTRVDPTGLTKLALRNKNYDADNSAPSWGSNLISRFQVIHSDTAGTTTDPKLAVIHYEPEAAPAAGSTFTPLIMFM